MSEQELSPIGSNDGAQVCRQHINMDPGINNQYRANSSGGKMPMGDHTLSQNEDQTGLDIIKPASFNQSSFERGGTSSNHLQSEKLHL